MADKTMVLGPFGEDDGAAESVVAIDGNEIMLIILEEQTGLVRPAGQDSRTILSGVNPDACERAYKASRRIAEYLGECLGGMQRVQ